MTIQIVIVTYRSANVAADCLRSLVGVGIGRVAGLKCVIADNNSEDETVQVLENLTAANKWVDFIRIMRLDRNGGFAFGNNAVIRSAMQETDPPDYFWLLNPDTQVHPGALAALVNLIESRPDIGIVGSLLESPDGVVERSAHRFPGLIGELCDGARLGVLDRLAGRQAERSIDLTQPTRHDWVSGASMLVRREVFERIGLMDEGYFLYFDEVDFCFRAARGGWETWLAPDSRVTHFEGASTGISNRGVRRQPYWYASRRRFFIKAHGYAGLFAADALWALGRASLAVRRLLRLGGDWSRDPAWFAYDLLWGDVKAVLTGRASLAR